MTTWMADAVLDRMSPDKDSRRKANRQRKLKVDRMKELIAAGKVKESIDIAEAIGLTPKAYGKIVAELNRIG